MIHGNHKAYRFAKRHPKLWLCPSNIAKIAEYLGDHELPYSGRGLDIALAELTKKGKLRRKRKVQ